MSISIDAVHAVVAMITVGVGATAILDLWTLFLKRVFNVAAANYCLVGRWLRYMPDGIFKHESIAAALPKPLECAVGWTAHYVIGIGFAVGLALIASPQWFERPTLVPALLFGIVTVAVPFLIMHPAFGLGVAASRTPNPTQARLRSLMAHTVFGIGLYASALALSRLI